MLRLTSARLREERGASATIAAILMVAIMVVAALVVDVASMHLERQQLQTGADAAALAIAQECARGSCGDPQATAQSFVDANHTYGGGDDTVTLAALPTPGSGTVTVTASSPSRHFFAPIIGIDETVVAASATAVWAPPSGTLGALPLILSKCMYDGITGGAPDPATSYTFYLSKHGSEDMSDDTDHGCTNAAGDDLPGAFSWVKPSGDCTLESSIDDTVESSTGNIPPSSCGPADFSLLQEQIIVVPLFLEYAGEGDNATYVIEGYIALEVTGYKLGNSPGLYWNAPGNGPERWISGRLVEEIPDGGSVVTDPDAPDWGTTAVRLVPTSEGVPA